MDTKSRKTTKTHAVVLRLTGPAYDSHDYARLARVRRFLLSKAEKAGLPFLVVDFSGVQHFGAGFIGTLVSTRKQLEKRKVRLVLCGLTPFCSELIQTVQLHELFTIYPSLSIAMDEIEQDSHPREELALGWARLDAVPATRRYDDRPQPHCRRATACCGN
jgi:anti-anti-sigma factor